MTANCHLSPVVNYSYLPQNNAFGSHHQAIVFILDGEIVVQKYANTVGLIIYSFTIFSEAYITTNLRRVVSVSEFVTDHKANHYDLVNT